MPNLTEALVSEAKKSAVEDDCLALIDAEVADKGGFTGLAIKAGYKTVQGIKPGFIRQVVVDLLPEFARALDPLYQEAKSAGQGVREHFNANAPRVAEAPFEPVGGDRDRAPGRGAHGACFSIIAPSRGTAASTFFFAVPRSFS